MRAACLMPRTIAPCKKGFTLIELLLVIAVIAILVTVLLPVVGSVRGRAASARCTGNLRSIGTALLNYATDNDGRIPAGWPTEGRTLMEADPEGNRIPAGLGSLQFFGYIDGPQGIPVRGPVRSQVFNCPTRVSAGWDAVWSNWGDYWYNFTGSNYDPDGARLEELPVGKAVVYDYISLDTKTAVHDGGTSANVLYLDGSVRKFTRPEFRSTDRNTCFNL